MYEKGKKSNVEVYRKVLSIGLQKWEHQCFLISGSPKLCYSLRNLILLDCMQLEKLFSAHQDLLEELKHFLADCKGPTPFPNVPASARPTSGQMSGEISIQYSHKENGVNVCIIFFSNDFGFFFNTGFRELI